MNDEPRPSSEMSRGHHQNCAPLFNTAHIGFPPIRSAVRWRLATLATRTATDIAPISYRIVILPSSRIVAQKDAFAVTKLAIRHPR